MLIIQQDCTTGEAREWLTELLTNVFDFFDLEEVMKATDDEDLLDHLVYEAETLSARAVDEVVFAAIVALTT